MEAKYFGISDLGQLIFYILHFSMNAVLATSLDDLTFFRWDMCLYISYTLLCFLKIIIIIFDSLCSYLIRLQGYSVYDDLRRFVNTTFEIMYSNYSLSSV